MSEIELHKVTKTYNPGLFKRKVRAVTDLTLEIRGEEVFGLVGPNGAGKSTTIRMLLGMSRPDHGVIRFRGQPLEKADFRRQTGYLPENPYLYDQLTLEELLSFCARVSGLSTSEGKDRGLELMAKLGLLEACKRPLRTFSKGMLQRAGICFALLHDPSVVILDEPMSGLDPIGRRMVFDLVSELRDRGKTIFFCSHILSDVERLCDRIGVMVGGRLARVLEKEEFSTDPGYTVHLLLPSLSSDQLQALSRHSLTREEGGMVLSVTPSDLPTITQELREKEIPVVASRSGRLSLEELFMTIVEEHRT